MPEIEVTYKFIVQVEDPTDDMEIAQAVEESVASIASPFESPSAVVIL